MKKRFLTITLALLLVLGAVIGLSSCAAKSELPDAKDAEGTSGGVTWKYTADNDKLVITVGADGKIPDAESAEKVAWKDVRHSVTTLEIVGNVTEIGNYAFYYFPKLTSYKVPETVTRIGVQAFAYCSGLTSIEIPESVTSIGDSCFEACSALTSIQIPQNVTSLGAGAFAYCKSLKVVRILGNIEKIGEYTFRECKSLHTVAYNQAFDRANIAANAFDGANQDRDVNPLATPTGDVALTIRYVKEDGTLINLGENADNPKVYQHKVGDDYGYKAPTVPDFVVIHEKDGQWVPYDGEYYSMGTARENKELTVVYRQKAAETAAPADTAADGTTPPAEKEKIGPAQIIAIVAFGLVIVGIIVVVILMMRSDKKKGPAKGKSNQKTSNKKKK